MKKIIYLIFILLILSGCKDESTPPVNLTFEIQPLITGSKYYYIDSTIVGEIRQVDSTRITIPGKTTLTGGPNSQEVAIWNVYTNGSLIRQNFINREEDGLYHYAEINGDDTLFIRKIIAKYPVNEGEQFTEPQYSYNAATGEYDYFGLWKWTCISIDTQITYRNGETLFNHVFRTKPDNEREVLLFYALNIGYTGREIRRNSVLEYKQVLIDYEIP